MSSVSFTPEEFGLTEAELVSVAQAKKKRKTAQEAKMELEKRLSEIEDRLADLEESFKEYTDKHSLNL